VAQGTVAADVDRDSDPLRSVRMDDLSSESRVADGRCTDDSTRPAAVQGGRDCLYGPKPAGGFDTSPLPDRAGDRVHDASVCRDTGPRRVKVDDVDPPCSLFGELTGDSDRIGGEDRLSTKVALLQTHDGPAAEIDRGQDLEHRCLRHGSMLP
jgi:hypothetical protein